MGTIMTRAKKDGSQSYTATIRKKQKGKVVLTLTETFPNERSAKRWIKQRESELKAKGALDKAIQSRKRKTWSDVIADYSITAPRRRMDLERQKQPISHISSALISDKSQ